MEESSGALVELDFYFGPKERREALAAVVEHCLAHGGRFAGEAWEAQERYREGHRLARVFDHEYRAVSLTAEELYVHLRDERTDVMKVDVRAVLSASPSAPEEITFCAVSDEASMHDSPPIAIVGQGWVFSIEGYEPKAYKLGRRCYDVFRGICASLNPDYGAILVEDSLPCRFDLSRGRGQRCFLNFFVSERAYGSRMLRVLDSMYGNAYTENFGTGLYVSTWYRFNPRQVSLDNRDAVNRSAAVAAMLRNREQ